MPSGVLAIKKGADAPQGLSFEEMGLVSQPLISSIVVMLESVVVM